MIRIALILLLILTSCTWTQRPAYKKAYADRECNHSHICCQVGCACCGPPRITRKKHREQKRFIRKYRRELRKNDEVKFKEEE
jgi:hypothetical protein